MALLLRLCGGGWGSYTCIVIKDQNECDRIYFPSAFSLPWCLLEGNNIHVSMTGEKGEHGYGEGGDW